MNSLYTAEGVMDKHSLWQRYVPLVRHEALRLQVRLPASVELDDLLQAGGIGLLNAVDRYDALQRNGIYDLRSSAYSWCDAGRAAQP